MSFELGFNYGHQTVTAGAYDLSVGGQVEKDLKILKAGGINHLAIAMGTYSSASYDGGNDKTQILAKYVKAKGFYVSFGVVAPSNTNNDYTNWLTHLSVNLPKMAQFCQANGIDEFNLPLLRIFFKASLAASNSLFSSFL